MSYTRDITRRRFVALGSAAAASLLVPGCSATTPSESFVDISDTQFYFDTVCEVTGTMSPGILAGVFDRCDFFQRTLSAQEEGSDIDRINKAAGAPVDVEPETAEVLQAALRYCEESEGLLDITIGAASLLWDFKAGVIPDADTLARAVEHIDYRLLDVDGTTVRLADPEAKLDVGGVAKGYIADDLINYLASHGVESAFVNLGGNVKTLGTKPDGSPWQVGIQDPNADAGGARDASTIMARVSCQGESVVTSGLYERVFEKDSKRYWHILDPRTGWPVETDVASASIVSSASIDGDGYTKALFMWGADKVASFFEAHPELQGMIVREDGSTWTSPNAAIELR